MRAQLAITSLIVFGVLLIGLGFVQIPFVASYRDTVVVQTSSTTVADTVEVVETTVDDTYVTTSITLKTTITNFYTVGVETTVTETRYSDLSFMAFMGSFLVFVGLLFMVLMLKAMPRPVEKSKISRINMMLHAGQNR